MIKIEIFLISKKKKKKMTCILSLETFYKFCEKKKAVKVDNETFKKIQTECDKLLNSPKKIIEIYKCRDYFFRTIYYVAYEDSNSQFRMVYYK